MKVEGGSLGFVKAWEETQGPDSGLCLIQVLALSMCTEAHPSSGQLESRGLAASSRRERPAPSRCSGDGEGLVCPDKVPAPVRRVKLGAASGVPAGILLPSSHEAQGAELAH